uniref:type I protein arginine methyltransferase n=1 Tax=Salarias fasciatus TaxID=181472 RepID=A0A672J2A3_SALFA
EDCCQVGAQSFLVTIGRLSLLLQFKTPTGRYLKLSCDLPEEYKDVPEVPQESGSGGGSESRRTRGGLTQETTGGPPGRAGEALDAQRVELASLWCVQFQSCLGQQQSLLQDHLRIATYQRAILANESDFRDKVVLDVCCGSAILSFFSVQAGASRVYAVESSPAATYTQVLVRSNHVQEKIRVLEGSVEEVRCAETVDVIISEPMGYMLLNRKLMDDFLYAKKWLKPNGLLFPSCADIHLAPFTDEQLYFEHCARAAFWQQRSFYGVNLSALHAAAVDEFFKQPIVDTFDVHVLMAKSVKHSIDFLEATQEDLHRIDIPFVFPLLQSGLIHGLAFWFDVAYRGSSATVWLSTAPTEPLTRWSQVRCLLQTPLFARLGQTLSGSVLLTANNRQSYDIQITATVDQSGCRSGNCLDLKNPFLR